MHRRTFLWASAGALVGFPAGSVATPEWTRVLDWDQVRVRLTVSGLHDLDEAVLTAHVKRSIEAVAAYYGRFPTPICEVRITASDQSPGWGHGRAFGGSLPRVKVAMGGQSTLADLQDDWVLVHELVHLACPMLPDAHHWFEEGLSTYVEPWIRVPLGELSANKAWGDLVQGLPQGQPGPGDRGLDRTPTWGRTYWGGALFCLLADLELRRETPSRGVREAFQGVVSKGWGMHQKRSMAELMDALDQQVQREVFTSIWRAHSDRPVRVDLAPIWAELGVVSTAMGTRLVDAPGARIRTAICPESLSPSPSP